MLFIFCNHLPSALSGMTSYRETSFGLSLILLYCLFIAHCTDDGFVKILFRLKLACGAKKGLGLTFPSIVGQNGACPHLFALDGLTGAGLRASRPHRPLTEDTVSRARNFTGHGLRGWRGRAQTPVHLIS